MSTTKSEMEGVRQRDGGRWEYYNDGNACGLKRGEEGWKTASSFDDAKKRRARIVAAQTPQSTLSPTVVEKAVAKVVTPHFNQNVDLHNRTHDAVQSGRKENAKAFEGTGQLMVAGIKAIFTHIDPKPGLGDPVPLSTKAAGPLDLSALSDEERGALKIKLDDSHAKLAATLEAFKLAPSKANLVAVRDAAAVNYSVEAPYVTAKHKGGHLRILKMMDDKLETTVDGDMIGTPFVGYLESELDAHDEQDDACFDVLEAAAAAPSVKPKEAKEAKENLAINTPKPRRPATRSTTSTKKAAKLP